MKQFFKKLLGSSFDVRKGELALVILMLSNYFFILLAYYLLKPTRDALFLVNVSPAKLPFVYILVAIFTAPFVALYNRVSNKAKFNDVVAYATLIIIATLVLLKFLMKYQVPVIYYFFYIWVSVLGALIVSQFWIFANTVFDASQAKRIFGILGFGGIAGSIAGSQLTTILLNKKGINFSSEDLLYVAAAFLGATVVFFKIVWNKKFKGELPPATKAKPGTERKESAWQVIKTVRRSKYLVLIVSIAAMTVILSTFVDYQFKVISKAAYPDKDQLAIFLASINTWLNLGSLILQGFFTNRILKHFGVTGILLILPIGQLMSFTAMLIAPGIAAGIMMRSAESSLRYSMDKTGKELLFLPVPIETTRRMKVFLDVFVDRWGRGIGGLILALFTVVWVLDVQYLSIVAIVLSVIWLLMTLPMRKEFVNAFRKAIEKRQINLNELRLKVDDAQSLNAVIGALGSRNDRQVLYALKMLDAVEDKELRWPVKALLTHPSEEIRSNALKIMHRLGDTSDSHDVEMLLEDANIGIRSDAIHFLCNYSNRNRRDMIREYLRHPDPKIRYAAIACAVAYGDVKENELISTGIIEELLASQGEGSNAGRIELAKKLGIIETPNSSKYFRQLLDDNSPEVVIAAIESIGRQRVREFVPWLINHLSDRNLRQHCRKALVAFGTRVLGTLNDYLNDEHLPLVVRRQIPRVMSEIPHQDAVNLLTHSLEAQNSWLAYDILKGLNKLRAKDFDLQFSEKDVEHALQIETRNYYEILQILNAQSDTDAVEGQLLKKALRERLDSNFEKIFRLIGLKYPPRDIYNAYLNMKGKNRVDRARAMEFLDNLLESNIRKYVLPILDDVSPDITAAKGTELFKLGIKSREDGLAALINGNNVWLKVCAIYNVKTGQSQKLTDLVKLALQDRDPMVREVAHLVLSQAA